MLRCVSRLISMFVWRKPRAWQIRFSCVKTRQFTTVGGKAKTLAETDFLILLQSGVVTYRGFPPLVSSLFWCVLSAVKMCAWPHGFDNLKLHTYRIQWDCCQLSWVNLPWTDYNSKLSYHFFEVREGYFLNVLSFDMHGTMYFWKTKHTKYVRRST